MVRGSLGGQRSGAGCSGCNGQDLGTKGNGQDRGSCCVGPKEPNDTYRTSVVITLGRGLYVDKPGVRGTVWIQGTASYLSLTFTIEAVTFCS